MTKYISCPSCLAILEVDESGCAREMEWWELLDWSTMETTWKKLPPEIQNKIRIKMGDPKFLIEDKPKPQKKSQSPSGAAKTIEDIRILFSKDQDDLLEFHDMETWIKIVPRTYLGPGIFSKVRGVIEEAGGRYVGSNEAGKKNAHFRIDK